MNTATTPMRTGARVLIDALAIHGVDTVFGVPGESYLDVLDVLHDHPSGMRFLTCRQEGGASYMAEAYGKLTGRPGVCFVTRGPGATNGSIGVHTAQQDSTPMVLFVGQVARDMVGREAFQEVDYRQMFGGLAKWATQIDDPARTPEIVARAFRTAASGRPGPVVVALPEDMLREPCATPDTPPYTAARAHPGADDLESFRDLLEAAERPLVMLGGGGWSAQACRDAAAFAAAHNLPVTVSFRCQDYIDNTLPHYAGDVGIGLNPPLAERVKNADLLIVIGPRLGEMTTQGYTLLKPPVLAQTLVHVHPDPAELGRVYQPALAINAGGAEFLAAVRGINAVDGSRWADWTAAARADYEGTAEPSPAVGNVDMATVALHLRDTLPADAVMTTGAGNFAGWTQRFYRFSQYRTQLSPTNGSMGYGVPAAIAAQALHPDRVAIAMTGDGDFLMTGQELATAAQYGLKPVIILVNNGMYGTIRMHQEREHPARISGTALTNPDFVKLAEAYGAHGERVTETDQFPAALDRALNAGKAALIELRVDPELITSRTSLSKIREAALARQAG